MIWQIFCALFSPDLEKLVSEVWAQYQESKREQTSIAVDQGFEQAKESQNTEALAGEIGKLIK